MIFAVERVFPLPAIQQIFSLKPKKQLMKILQIILLFLASIAYAGGIKSSAEVKIRSQFDVKAKLIFKKYTIPADKKSAIEKRCRQRFYRGKVYVWEIRFENAPPSIAVLDNVPGKAMPITFMVIFDWDGAVRFVDIIKYRESIGGAVANRRWLRQFEGWRAASQELLKNKIDGLSGATISANSIIAGVQKLALLFPEIKKEIDNANFSTQVTE